MSRVEGKEAGRKGKGLKGQGKRDGEIGKSARWRVEGKAVEGRGGHEPVSKNKTISVATEKNKRGVIFWLNVLNAKGGGVQV